MYSDVSNSKLISLVNGRLFGSPMSRVCSSPMYSFPGNVNSPSLGNPRAVVMSALIVAGSTSPVSGYIPVGMSTERHLV